MRSHSGVLRRLIRGIVVANFTLLALGYVPVLNDSLDRALRATRITHGLFWWSLTSTLALPIILASEVAGRWYQRKQTSIAVGTRLIDRNILIDATLVTAWLVYLLLAAMHSAARFI